ncbi:tellurite resistance TerB family protein [Photobacterium leiognathi]|uniref:tellurite resistance TerB family protein n=1 Tax=Photobacterium leiognathi TaxID=553611 RepID=UPI0029816F67|nr:tellurite resistance TerB family protein [Photobacterium leiognathi]
MKGLFDQLINQASNYMEKGKSASGTSSADLLKGATAGGLVGALLGNKKTRKLARKYGGKAAVIGGTAVIGTVAYQAYKKWSQESSHASNVAMESQPTSQQTTMLKTNQDLLVQAMIFAAKADGHIDEQEKATIAQWMLDNGINHDIENVIVRWLNAPLDPQVIATQVIATQVNGLEQASEVYLVTLLAIDVDHFLERAYLDALAKSLQLPSGLIQRIEEQASQM